MGGPPLRSAWLVILLLVPLVRGLEAPCEPSLLGVGACTSWVFTHDGGLAEVEPFVWGQGGVDGIYVLAASADGNVLYAAGDVQTGTDNSLPVTDLVVFAFDAATGAHRWTARSDWGDDRPAALLLREDLGLLFVTGSTSSGPTWNDDLFVAAYRTADGSLAWQDPYDGPAHFRDVGVDLAYSEIARTLVVGGTSMAPGSGGSQRDFILLSYDPLTGERRTLTRWDATLARSEEYASHVAVSPDGSLAYLTGSTSSRVNGSDAVATVAFDLATGAPVWTHLHDGPARGWDFAGDLAPTPEGDVLYVALGSGDEDSMDPTLFALDAATGAEQWSLRVPSAGLDRPTDLQLSADGRMAWIASGSGARAIDLASARVLWHQTSGARLALTPQQDRVFSATTVWRTGTGFDCVIRGYDAMDGSAVFAADYRGLGWGDGSSMDPILRDTCTATVVAGDRVIVAGDTWRPGTSADGLVAAYRLSSIVQHS